MTKIAKRYKFSPAHKYWFNDGKIERVTGDRKSDINIVDSYDLKTGESGGCLCYGYNLMEGFKKATKEDYEEAKLKSVV